MTPRLSAVIVNWNTWPDLRRCLASLRAEGADGDVVVIDNASTDGSVENLRRDFPHVRVHVNPSNVGHTRAMNQGFAQAEGEYLLVLDADTELLPGAAEALLRFMEGRPDVSLAAPRLFNADGSVQETARNFPSFMSGLFGRHSRLTRLFPNNPFSRRYLLRDRLHETEPFPVEQVTSACMILRRTLLAETGPWDEGYAGYFVDTDYCMRLKKLGKKVYCVPAARVIHQESNQPGKKRSWRRIWLFHMGAYRFYREHFTWGTYDPRSLGALALLGARATLLSLQEHYRPPAAPNPDPLSRLGQVDPEQEVLQ